MAKLERAHGAEGALMTREEIDRMEAGWRRCAEGQRVTQHCALLEAAVQAEREACAKIAQEWDEAHPETNYGRCIAVLIRARGKA